MAGVLGSGSSRAWPIHRHTCTLPPTSHLLAPLNNSQWRYHTPSHSLTRLMNCYYDHRPPLPWVLSSHSTLNPSPPPLLLPAQPHLIICCNCSLKSLYAAVGCLVVDFIWPNKFWTCSIHRFNSGSFWLRKKKFSHEYLTWINSSIPSSVVIHMSPAGPIEV